MKLSLTTKIFLAFSLVLSLFALLAVFSVREFRDVGEDLRSINDGHLMLARLAGQLETHQQNRFRDLRRGLAVSDPRSREDVLRIAAAYFPEVVRSRIEELRVVCRRQLARVAQRDDAEARARRDFYRRILTLVDRIGERHEGVDELTDRLLERVRAGAEHPDLDAQLDPLEAALRGELYQLNKTISDETERAVRRTESDERNAIWRVVLMTGLALLIGVTLTLLSAKALAPISKLVAFARAISRGDYEHTLDVHGEDELSALADELRSMARNRKEREADLDRQQAELERAYHRVAELMRYHESVVQSLRTSVLVTDRDLAITSANRAAERHFGGQVRGRNLTALPTGAKLVERLGSLGQLIERAEARNVPGLLVGDMMVDVTLAPFVDERGAVLGLVLAIEDVTEAARTKEALIRSERLAAIGRMSAHVTHEVRNPLSSIGLNAELLEQLVAELAESKDPKVVEAQTLCRAIGREIDRLTAITGEYLRFARLPRPEVREEDVAELVRTLASFVRRETTAAGVALELSIPEGLPKVELDADQIHQALLNLVRNAKEATPNGGTITLGVDRHDGEVSLFVRDTGVGIAEENLDRIFDPFYSTKLTGTGLGLALSHQIVAEHGGEIRVSSKPGAGSEFRIALPIRKGAEIIPLSSRTRRA